MGMLIAIAIMAVILIGAYYLLVSRREEIETPRDREIKREIKREETPHPQRP